MAQQEVNQILQALQFAMGVREKRKTDAIEQQRADTQQKAEQDRIQAGRDQLAEQKRQFDISNKAAQAMHDLTLMHEEQQMGMQAAQTGITPAGVQVQSANSIPVQNDDTREEAAIPSGQQTTSQRLTFPSGHTIEVPTPEVYAQRQADLSRIANKPAEEAKTREQQSLQDAETGRQLRLAAQAHADRLAELAQENTYQTQRQNDNIRAQQALHASEGAISIRQAMINATGGLSETSGAFNQNKFNQGGGVKILTGNDGQPTVQQQSPSDFVTNTIRDLRDGKLTSDDLKKRFPKQAPAIMGMASEQGIGALSSDEKTKLTDLETAAQVAPVIHEMNLIRAQYPTEVLIPGTDAYKKFQTDEDLVGKAVPAISRVLSGVKRFNGVEMTGYTKSLIPRKNPLTSGADSGFQKYNDYVGKDLQDAFSTITSNLPEGQRAIIKQRVGLTSLPYLGGALKQQLPQGPSQGQQQSNTINVKRKSDGVVGTIPLQNFDPKKYDKVDQ